ncbi:MAG: GNAT family N-acetyltransferase [Dehalococcoidales bacterium]|nr:GNAT family N-acetyltransferase [Dehalococcoidales bacterium]
MDKRLVIRRYLPEDKAAVWQLHYDALRPTGAMLPGGPWNDDFNEIPAHYLIDGGDFLVGLIGDNIVCMGALRKKSDSVGEIKRMRVHPDFQHQGYGQVILDKLENIAKEYGYTSLVLDTTTKQIQAQNFYQKNGYHETNRTVYAGLEIIFYEKRL